MRRFALTLLFGAGFLTPLPLAAASAKTEEGLIAALMDETPLLPKEAQVRANALYPRLRSPDPALVASALAGLREAGQSDGRYLIILGDLSAVIATQHSADAQLLGFEERLRHTLDTAKTPGELDPLISALDAAKEKADAGPSPAGFSTTLGLLSAFAVKWQAYLSLVQTSNPAGANQILNDLANDPSATAYYPRERILQRQVSKLTSTAGPDLDPVKTYRLIEPLKLTVDNLDEMIADLADHDAQNIPMMEDLYEALGRLKQEVVQLALGSGQKTLADSNYFEFESLRLGPYASRVRDIHHALKLRAIAIGVRAGPDLQGQPGEDPEAYLQRIFAANSTAHNWDQVSRAIDISRFALAADRLSADTPLTRALRGYRFFLAGQHYESRQSWELAARAYADALGVREPLLPDAAFRAALEAIGKAHPGDAAQASALPDPPGFVDDIQAGGLYIPHHLR